jgi:hypothetical protein
MLLQVIRFDERVARTVIDPSDDGCVLAGVELRPPVLLFVLMGVFLSPSFSRFFGAKFEKSGKFSEGPQARDE